MMHTRSPASIWNDIVQKRQVSEGDCNMIEETSGT
jgi:hypothetical protein